MSLIGMCHCARQSSQGFGTRLLLLALLLPLWSFADSVTCAACSKLLEVFSWDPYLLVNFGILIDFQRFSFKIMWFQLKIKPEWLRHRSEYFQKVILIWKIASTVNFWTSKPYFQFSTPLKFQFSSITHFLDHKIEDPFCGKGSYGPPAPFWFSPTFGFW